MHFAKYPGYSINNRVCSQAFHCDFECFAMEFTVLRYFIRICCIFCTFRCILTFCCPLLNFHPFLNIFSSVLCYFVVRFCIFIHFQHYYRWIFFIYSFIYIYFFLFRHIFYPCLVYFLEFYYISVRFFIFYRIFKQVWIFRIFSEEEWRLKREKKVCKGRLKFSAALFEEET